MNTIARAIRELEAERARLETIIRSLRDFQLPGAGRRGASVGRRANYRLSPEGRQRIAEAARKRWAMARAARKTSGA